ncbi:PAR2 protein, partial [Halcyon senegalensis]|nr:PAR2 protein [Halcyon senegalensis]
SYHLLGNHWLFGEYLCRAMMAFFYGNMYSSILFLTCIGLERYISVVHPFLWKGSSCTWCKVGICVGIWLMVALGTSPLLLNTQTRHISSLNITTCHDFLKDDDHKYLGKYFLLLVGLGFGLPFVLVTFSYSCILVRLRAQGRRYGQLVCVLALVLLVFILCFTPSNVLLFIHYTLETEGCNNNISYILYTVALVLSAFNNCFDPFIYFYISQDFRGWVRDACSCCLWRPETSSGKALEKAVLPLRSSEQSQ